jgi:hypothetical protein
MAGEFEKAKASLERIQSFDTGVLPGVAQLGQALNFTDAVEPASRLINLFRQYPIQFLGDLPANQQTAIGNSADAIYNILQDITKFDPKTGDAYNRRQGLIQTLRDQYQGIFNQIFPLIAYGASRQRDFDALEREYRTSMQRADDAAEELRAKMEAQELEGKKILEEIRSVAAEQGVSQQAVYFKTDSDEHWKESEKWRKYTVRTALALGAFAVVTMFLHKIPGLVPQNAYDNIQLGISKVLIFAVLGYMVLLCARNFLAHKHNEIVNRHRQNALLTFKALADAAGTMENRDVVLTYAAACIFAPQETGYTRPAESGKNEMPLNIIQTLPKLMSGEK